MIIMRYPKFSIVVAAYNEEKDIPKLLNSLIKIDYPKNRLEIIVVDDGSTDRTSEIVSKYPVKLIKGPHKGVGFARNLGFKDSGGKIVSFIDADLVLDKGFVKEVVKEFEENPKAGGLQYTIKLLNKKSLISRLLYLRKLLGMKQPGKVIVSNMFKRKILEKLNGYKPRYGYYDDWELSRRVVELGYKTIPMKKALIWHKEPENWKDLWRQCKWAGKSIIFLFKDYKKIAIRRVLFTQLCASLPLYVIFLIFPPPLQSLGIVGFMMFFSIEIWRSLKMYLITKWKESFLTPLFDFISMFFVCVGMLIGMMYIRTKPKV